MVAPTIRVGIPTRDRTELALVLLVWVGMVAWALVYVRAYGPPFPFGDEGHLWSLLPPRGELSWSRLWEPKNEHRVPLPRLLHYLPYAATRDLRAPLVLEVAILAAAALVWIAIARRIRGRASVADTLFPLLFLHVGNADNLLSGFQITLMLPTALAAGFVAGIAVSPAPPRAARASLFGAALVALTLSGGAGLIHALVLGAWMALAAVSGMRSADASEKRGARILAVFLLIAGGIAAAALAERAHPHWYRYSSDPSSILGLAAAVLTLAYGPQAAAVWPASGILLSVVVAATAVLLVRAGGRGSAERLRRLGLFASIVSTAGLALSIGIARGEIERGFSPVSRYVALAIPLVCGVYAAWTLYAGPRGRAIVCGGLALAAWAVLPGNARTGIAKGRGVLEEVQRFEAIVGRGADADEILGAYIERFPFHMPNGSRLLLRALDERRDPPFDRGAVPAPEAFDFPSFSRPAASVESDAPPTIRWIDGHGALVVRLGARIRFTRNAADRRISGVLGVPAELSKDDRFRGIRAVVEVRTRAGTVRRILERPLESPRDSFVVDPIPDDAAEIVLSTDRVAPASEDGAWTYWSEIRIE